MFHIGQVVEINPLILEEYMGRYVGVVTNFDDETSTYVVRFCVQISATRFIGETLSHFTVHVPKKDLMQVLE